MEASVSTEYDGCSIRADLGVIHWVFSWIAQILKKRKKKKQEK